MAGTCLIVSGGAFSPLPPSLPRPDRVIACDRGWQHAARLGLTPELVVGDFDSAPEPPEGVPVLRVPARKDDTDTMLAARMALDWGCREVWICCALGGRLDHTLANIQTAAFLAVRGVRGRVLGEDTELLAFAGGSERFPRRDGWSLSVFALSDRCEGVTVRGTKYVCDGAELSNAFPLGVSNVWTAEAAEVSVSRGVLLVVQSRLRPGEHI